MRRMGCTLLALVALASCAKKRPEMLPPPPASDGAYYPPPSPPPEVPPPPASEPPPPFVGGYQPVRPPVSPRRRPIRPQSSIVPDTGPARSGDGDATPFCSASGTRMSVAACRDYGDPGKFANIAHATLTGPRSMYRGDTVTVRFAITDRSRAYADALADAPGSRQVVRGAAWYAPRMEAQLTGEGFVIDPATPVRIDAGSTREAVWAWRVTALRGPRHHLRAESWVLRRDAAGRLVRGVRAFEPGRFDIDVPVRWVPEWLHDLMTDSLAWFGLGESWAKALAAVIAAFAALWVALRAFGRRAKA